MFPPEAQFCTRNNLNFSVTRLFKKVTLFAKNMYFLPNNWHFQQKTSICTRKYQSMPESFKYPTNYTFSLDLDVVTQCVTNICICICQYYSKYLYLYSSFFVNPNISVFVFAKHYKPKQINNCIHLCILNQFRILKSVEICLHLLSLII